MIFVLLFCGNLSSQMFWRSVVQPSCKEIAVIPIFMYGSSWPSWTKAREKNSISIILFLCPTTEPPCVGRLTGMHRNANSPKKPCHFNITSTSFHPTAHRHNYRSNRKGKRKWWLQKLILQTSAGSNECGQRQTEQDPSKHSITAKRLRWEVCLPESTQVSH